MFSIFQIDSQLEAPPSAGFQQVAQHHSVRRTGCMDRKGLVQPWLSGAYLMGKGGRID
jgi:hypothetical protein